MPRRSSDFKNAHAIDFDHAASGEHSDSMPETTTSKSDEEARATAKARLAALMKRTSHKKIMQILAK